MSTKRRTPASSAACTSVAVPSSITRSKSAGLPLMIATRWTTASAPSTARRRLSTVCHVSLDELAAPRLERRAALRVAHERGRKLAAEARGRSSCRRSRPAGDDDHVFGSKSRRCSRLRRGRRRGFCASQPELPKPGGVAASARTRLLSFEVLEVAARRRALLALVLRAEAVGAVRGRRGLGQLDERELADLHPVVDRDREVRDVRELERHVAVPAGVDEACGRVDEQAEAAERALPLEARDEVVGEPHALERRAEDELAGVEDERRLVVDLDEAGQVLLRLLDVDERVARVVEDAEVAVDAHVHARRLEQRGVVRIDLDRPVLEPALDRAVGENHRPILRSRLWPGTVTVTVPGTVRPSADRSAMLAPVAATRSIEIVTGVPGPRSTEILQRKGAVVADALSCYAPVVVCRGPRRDADGRRREHVHRLRRRGRLPRCRARASPRRRRRAGAGAALHAHGLHGRAVRGLRRPRGAALRADADRRPDESRVLQLRRGGDRERRQVRARVHRTAGGDRVRRRLPRPHAARAVTDLEDASVQGGPWPVRARGLPRSLPERLPRPGRRYGARCARGRPRHAGRGRAGGGDRDRADPGRGRLRRRARSRSSRACGGSATSTGSC